MRPSYWLSKDSVSDERQLGLRKDPVVEYAIIQQFLCLAAVVITVGGAGFSTVGPYALLLCAPFPLKRATCIH